MTKLRRRLRRVLIVLTGLIVVAVGVLLAALFDGGTAKAVSTTCQQTNSGGTYVDTVSLGDGVTTLTDAGGLLQFNGTGCTVGTSSTITTIPPTSIVLAIGSGATSSDIQLFINEATGSGATTQWFPCSVVTSGTTGGSLTVDGGAGAPLTAGGNGIDIGTTSTNPTDPDPAKTACSAQATPVGPNVTATGYATLDLVGGPVDNYTVTSGTPPTTTAKTAVPTLSAAGGPKTTGQPTVPVTLDGTRSGTTQGDTFVGGQQNDTFLTEAPGSVIDYSSADTSCTTNNCSLGVNTTGAKIGNVPAAQGTYTDSTGNTSQTYSITLSGTGAGGTSTPADFTQFRGLTAGPSTFWAPPSGTVTYDLLGNAALGGSTGSFLVDSSGSGNQVQAGAGTENYTVTGNAITLVGGTDTDTFTVDGTGNTFQPGTPSSSGETETFYDDQPGNIVNFSQVGTSSGAPLTVNVSGNPQAIPGLSSSATVNNGQAAVGPTTYYTFRNGTTSASASNFSTFFGANSGNTAFLAGGSGGLSFTGAGQADTAYFDGTATGVVANLSGGPQTITGAIGPSTILSAPFDLAGGQVLVGNPGAGITCSATSNPCDSIVGTTTLYGPSTGYSTFYAGPAPSSYTFTGAGDHNRFVGSSGTDTFSGLGNHNDFVAGSGSASFTEFTTQTGASADNTADFSNVPVGTASGCTNAPCSLKVNVSGNTSSNYQAVLRGVANQVVSTYSFGGNSDGAAFTTLIGASGGDTSFAGGLGNYTYTGQGSGNTLDFSQFPGSGNGTQSLTFNVATTSARPNPQLTLDAQTETFSGISNLIGLSTGNTTFAGGNTGGYTFDGQGAGNSADFTNQGPSTTLIVTVSSPASGDTVASQPVSGGTVKFELPDGTVLCAASPVVSAGSTTTGTATCNTANLAAGTQVLAIYTGATGTPINGSAYVVTPVAAVAGQSPIPTATSATTVQSGSLYQGQPATLTAGVTNAQDNSAMSGGTLSFSIAGGGSLCTIPSYSPGTNCTVGQFPAAGIANIVAQYTPPSANYLGSASTTQVTSNVPAKTTTTISSVPSCADDYYYDTTHGVFYGYTSVCTVTASVSASAGSLPTGNVNFALVGQPGQPPATLSCDNFDGFLFGNNPTSTSGQVGGGTTSATCSFINHASNATVAATYRPSTSPATVSPSVGTVAFTDGVNSLFGVNQYTATTTTLSNSGSATIQPGAPAFLQATVSDSAGVNLPAGGTVTFATGDGNVLNTVPVSAASPTATAQYAGSLPRSGSVDIIAYYTPPSGSSLFGSAFTLTGGNAITVSTPASSTASTTPAVNGATGAVLNLSPSASYTTPVSTARPSAVTLGPDEVLVSAPPGSAPASCTAASPAFYCDTLSDIGSVLGSSKGSNTFVAGTSSETFGDTGTVGGDTVNFADVGATSSAPLTVDATSGIDQGLQPDTAQLGNTATYTFSNGTNGAGNSDFANFIGSNTGYTTFLAAANPGESYTAAQANNSIDFSAAAAGVNVNLATPVSPATTSTCGAAPASAPGTVAIAGGTDTINGLSNITGSGAGGNTFCASSTSPDTFTGAGSSNTFVGGSNYSDTFNANGPNDTFVAGTGGYTISGTGSNGSTLDFTRLPGQPATSATLSINTASTQLTGPPAATATFNGATYNFSPLANSPKTIKGASNGTTFFAGVVSGDRYIGYSGAANELSYANDTSGPLTISATAGSAQIGAQSQSFANIGTFDGLPGGATDFVAGSGGPFTFNGSGTGNIGDFSGAGAPITADLRSSPATVAFNGITDRMTGVTSVIGATNGGNTFYASAANETFTDPGTTGGDTVNFSGVPTSNSSPLAVNVSGQPVNSSGTNVPNQTASIAGSYQYQLLSSGSTPEFTTIVGAANGSTTFFAGSSPPPSGYTFTGQGGNNQLNLSVDAQPVNVNLAAGTLNPNTAASTLDHLSGITSVTAPSGGSSFTGDANSDTFLANGNGDTFVVGTGGAAITDQGAGNTIDLSNQGGALTVNSVTGQATGVATTTFTLVPTTFRGSTAGGTTFLAGTLADAFVGQGSSPTSGTDNNTLSFANTNSAGPLSFCTAGVPGVGCGATLTLPASYQGTPGEALLGSTKEPFADVQTFDGLTSGNTGFYLGKEGHEVLNATGNNNLADFSGATSPVTVDLQQGTVCVSSCSGTAVTDSMTGISTVYGSSGGGNMFKPANSSATFGDRGTTRTDAVNFANVFASGSSPLAVNASSTYNGAPSDAAAVGSTGPTFTFGADATKFYGAGSGFTRFVAPASAVGYTFCASYSASAAQGCAAQAANDTLDLSANTTGGVAADLVGNTVSYVGLPGTDTIGLAGAGNGFTSVIGANAGTNTFYGDEAGTSFTSSSATNTLSYANVNGPVSVNLSQDTVGPAGGGNADKFSFPAGTPTIQGSKNGGDTYVVGSTAATLQSAAGKGDTLDLSATPSGATGDTVDLTRSTGTVSGPSIGTVNFAYGCSAGDLCPTAITGSHYADTFIAPQSLQAATTITGNGGTDSLDLSHTTGSATVAMPIGTGTGSVTLAKALTFSGIQGVTGTSGGGDTFKAGSGTESFTEPGVAGTLDLSAIGATKPSAGAQISVSELNGSSTGTATSSGLAISDSFTNLGTTDQGPAGTNSAAALIGTPGIDTFTQTSDGSFNFLGQGGSNILNLSGLSSTVTVRLTPPAPACGTGATTNDGTASDGTGAVNDTFQCMAQVVTAGSQTFAPAPNQAANLNGGGNGILYLGGDTGGAGLSIWLPNGSKPGRVEGDGYNVTFTGMSVVDGSQFDDTFYPGTGNLTINGGGGSDGISYRPPPPADPPTAWPAPAAAAQVNLSGSPYTIPGGATLPAGTATGGAGGTVTLQGIANALGTTQYNDVLVAGLNPGSLSGGTGNTRFVPTGGDDYINGGTGPGTTLDLSSLTGSTVLNLGVGTPQQTGAGVLTVVPGTIHTVIASNAGSQLFAGNGNVTLQGGPGKDTLAGGNSGTGIQTLISGGGNDTLIAGTGTQNLNGGSAPVTFVPGSGSDTLLSSTTGNTLSYASATKASQVNLSPNTYTVPNGKPLAGTTLAGDTATGGNGATVNLAQAGITAVTGSPAADLIVTSPPQGSPSAGNTINGNGGNDLIVVTNGNNTLDATGSSTFLMDGAGNNVINGNCILVNGTCSSTGPAASTIDFSQAPAGVTVNLQPPTGQQNGSAVGGFGGTQSLTGILNVVGTNYNDVLVGGADGGTINGLNATSADFLQAGQSGHDTLLNGGNGSDTFCAEASCAQPGTSTAGGDTMTGGGGNDTFYAANGVVDTVNGGPGYNQGTFDPNDIVTNVQVRS